MESNAGSTLLPIIKIINNTRTELANIVLSYEGLDDSSIKINTLNSNSEIIALGEKADAVEKGFGKKLENNTAFLEGVVSRKKQLLPSIDKNI